MWFNSLWNGLKSTLQSTTGLLKKGAQFVWNNIPQILSGVKNVSRLVARFNPAWGATGHQLVERGADFAQDVYDYVQSRSLDQDTGQLSQQ